MGPASVVGLVWLPWQRARTGYANHVTFLVDVLEVGGDMKVNLQIIY